MGDELILFALFVFLYVSDSFFFLHKHSVAFREASKGNYNVVLPSSNAGNRDYAVHMFSLLPPLRILYICNILPVSLTEKGILSYVSQTLSESGRPRQSRQAVEFDKINSVKVDDVNLFVNDRHFVNCRVSENANIIASTVGEIIKVNGHGASKIIDNLINAVFDLNKLSQILDEYGRASKSLRYLCNAMFIVFFVVFPIVAQWKGVGISLIVILVSIFVLLPPLCVTFFLLHKKYSLGSKWDRIGCIIRFVICPPCSIRANDQISRFLVAKYHPAIGALALCSTVDAMEYLRKTLRDLRNPIHQDINTDLSKSIDEGWRRKLISAIELAALKFGFKNNELLDAPKKSDPSVLAYCPRCLVEYSVPIDSCPDCLGVKTILFSSSEGIHE